MNILLLKGFNNYFNRIVKKYSTLADYKNNSNTYLEFSSINFNPNDGVATSLVIGGPTQTEGDQVLFWEYNGTPDYLIAYDSGDGEDVIRSRWFVLESERTRTGQYRIALKRDSIAEFYTEIRNAPCFIEKAQIQDVNDPLIFNKESMTYNQIKSSELRLFDETNIPWIVGYIARNTEAKTVSATKTQPITDAIDAEDLPWNFDPSITYYDRLRSFKYTATVVNDISSQTYYKLIQDQITVNVGTTDTRSSILIKGEKTAWPSYDIRRVYSLYTNAVSGSGDWGTYGNDAVLKSRAPYITSSEIINDLATEGIIASANDFPDLLPYNGVIVKLASKYYRLDISYTTTSYSKSRASGTLFDSWITKSVNSASQYNNGVLNTSLKLHMNATTSNFLGTTFDYVANVDRFTVNAVEVTSTATIEGNIPAEANRPHLSDAPYDMFCIPYGTITVSDVLAPDFSVDKDASMAFAMEFAKDVGSANLYDLQLLPYCPVRHMISNGEIDRSNGTEGADYNIITATDPGNNTTNVSIILWAVKAADSFDIPVSVQLDNYSEDDVLNLKINNECNLYRLVSPNYSGQFEFSVAKNGGSVSNFNVDYTYRPYNPYIHINPNFGGLYGIDFDDARGLICGGDFSLPVVSSAWTDYQVSNKNYQEIFDRQIQNMDVNNQIAKEQASFSAAMGAITGGFGGAAGGAITGAKVGGGYGAVAGAAVGAVGGIAGGLIGGALDQQWLARQQWEARDYAIDMYGYQLGNIQAMPYSLTKTSALTNNNKLVPLLEKYTCTNTEIEKLRYKLQYDGMTVMAIGNVKDYIGTSLSFVKGTLIRLDELIDDSHIADAIYQELAKGVFISPELEV